MQGYHFIVIESDGMLGITGSIIEVLPGYQYLCQFNLGPTTHQRVVDLPFLKACHLFPNESDMNMYIETMQARSEAEDAKPVETNDVETLTPQDLKIKAVDDDEALDDLSFLD